MPWKKGQSGNPGGRPKLDASLREAAQALTPKALEVVEKILLDPKAARGERLRAADIIFDRAFGKPPQAITDDRENALLRKIDGWLDGLSDGDLRTLRKVAGRAANGSGESRPH